MWSKDRQILAAISTLQTKVDQMALDISKLTAAVANETTVEQSAITLLGTLTAEIQSLINASGNTVDPAALQALVDQMTASQTALAAAVAADTPAATTPTTAPAATPAPTPSGGVGQGGETGGTTPPALATPSA